MAKDLRFTVLLDFYGDMLTDTQRDVAECYYNEDMSLGEISELRGITRQGVRDSIKRSEQQLTEMEERLGLVKRFREVQETLTDICDRAIRIKELCGGSIPEIDEHVEVILESAKELFR